MENAYLIKYAEIGIKGKNRGMFEDRLVRHIERALRKLEHGYTVTREFGRIYVYPDRSEEAENTETGFADSDTSRREEERVLEALQHVFGISGICPVVVVDDEGVEKLEEQIVSYMRRTHPEEGRSFKVFVRRANKQYPIASMKLASDLGAAPEQRRKGLQSLCS